MNSAAALLAEIYLRPSYITAMQASPLPPRPRSRLESLPAEIIQSIFLHCLDFNFPQASIYLTRALSDPVLYAWLIRLAFSSANAGAQQGFFTPDYLPPPLDFFAYSALQRSELQTSILARRWCTLSLMRKCQRQHIAHCIRRKTGHLLFSEEDRARLSESSLQAAFDAAYAHQPPPTGGKGDLVIKATVLDTKDAGGLDTPGDEERKLAIWFNTGAFQIRTSSTFFIASDVFQLPACDRIHPARIPDTLLRAPWTPTKLDLLHLLSTEAYIDDDDDLARSSAVLADVIRARDFDTFDVLANMSIRTRLRASPLQWPLLASHYYAAIRYADARDDPFIRYLVYERWDDIPSSELGLKNELLARI